MTGGRSMAQAAGGTGLSDEVLDAVDVLRDRPRQVEELPGGLTNRNFRVTTPQGSYVVRVSPEDTSALAINREHEYRNSVIAARSGVGAPVVAYLPERHVLVVRYIEGTTFTDESFAVAGTIERVAAACRSLHSGAAFVNGFDMFRIQRQYLAIVQENGYRLPPRYLEFAPHAERIRRALVTQSEGTVPCNNDLLAANLIDDGEKIWVIDYEYAGNNDACFELGNIWSECHLDTDQLHALVTAYYGRWLRNKVARAQLQGLMSKYGWTLWASIQDATSTIDFGFWDWGMEKYESAVAIFESARFGQLLDEVQRPD